MRRTKISLKKLFLIIVTFSIFELFEFIVREKEIWNPEHLKMQYYKFEITEAKKISTISSELTIQEKNTVDDDAKYLNSSTTIQSKPWYFESGHRYPLPARRNKRRIAKLFPQDDPKSDRITNQLMFIPPNYEEFRKEGRVKTIVLDDFDLWGVVPGREVFLQSKCPVDTCFITEGAEESVTADLIIHKDIYMPTAIYRPNRQVTMIYFYESPFHTENVGLPDAINWTATYRKDSDIVAPYGKWEYYEPRVKQLEQHRNYALNKTKKVAWFVSNCFSRNARFHYAQELQKFIQVDIYGRCGPYSCPRDRADHCFDILDRDYKFYLAFENSNCKDYITEKFFVNALGHNILPVVMGARPEDYEERAPYKSYIHVDDFTSPKELAEYLNMLDKNDDLYNSYFKWKGTGEFIDTLFWCRVCAMLHDEDTISKPKWYPNFDDWWKFPGVCTNGSWSNFEAENYVIDNNYH